MVDKKYYILAFLLSKLAKQGSEASILRDAMISAQQAAFNFNNHKL